MFIANSCTRLDALPVESSFVASSEDFERACFPNCIGPDEDPVLPGGKATENTCLHRLSGPKTQTRLHSGQRVRRETRALFESEANFIVPVEHIGRRCNEAVSRCFCRA